MATTLTYSGTTLTLPDGLLWPDEFDWFPVQVTESFSVSGAYLVDAGTKQAGRKITLSDDWCTRALVEGLYAWSLLPLAQMTLLHRGVTRTVIFDQAGKPMTATPVFEYADGYASTDKYLLTLRFIQIA